jgi:hypothetical protein
MLLFLAVLFALAWLFGFGVYHVASWTIHLLLIAAVVALVFHFVSAGRRRRTIV